MTRYRSSITGHYVTEEYAAAHPDTTVAEADPLSEEEKAAERERLQAMLAASRRRQGYGQRVDAIEARLEALGDVG